jgi:hypothetical protein
MEGFSFVTHVTGLNSPNTGKEDDDGESYFNCQLRYNDATQSTLKIQEHIIYTSHYFCMS